MDDFFASSFVFISLALLLVTIVLAKSIKVAHESERFAIFLMGRFVGYKGPGLVIKTHNMRAIRLKVGDIGTLISHEFAKFDDTDIPVSRVNLLQVGDPVRIDGFDDDGPRLVKSSVPPKTRCPNCGQEF